MGEFLGSSWWNGVAAIVAIISAMVPVFIYFIGRTREEYPAQRRTSVRAVVRQGSISNKVHRTRSGCARFMLSSTLNIAACSVHYVLTFGLMALLIASSDQHLQSYREQLNNPWIGFWHKLLAGCSGAIMSYSLLFFVLVGSVIIGIRWGYASGAYLMTFGNTVTLLIATLYQKIIDETYKLSGPTILSVLAAMIFVIVIIWATDLAVNRTISDGGDLV